MSGVITAEKYKQCTGEEPELDDLERVNCPYTGGAGHYTCGWCLQCNLPRFQCGHMLPIGNLEEQYERNFS